MTIFSFEEAERHLDRAWSAALVGAAFDLVIGAMAILGTRTAACSSTSSRGACKALLPITGFARRGRRFRSPMQGLCIISRRNWRARGLKFYGSRHRTALSGRVRGAPFAANAPRSTLFPIMTGGIYDSS